MTKKKIRAIGRKEGQTNDDIRTNGTKHEISRIKQERQKNELQHFSKK